MISPSLHPDPVRAVCERRRRWSFGLTPRTIGLLCVGFLWLIPGFWDGRLGYAMLLGTRWFCWLRFSTDCACPRAAQLSGHPHLVERSGARFGNRDRADARKPGPHDRRLPAGGRSADRRWLPSRPTHRLMAFPRVPARLRYRVEPTGTRRLRDGLALRSLSIAAGTG